MGLALAARMGQATVRGEDADAFALDLRAAAREINYAAADLYPVAGAPANLCHVDPGTDTGAIPTTPDAAAKCLGYRVNFESEVPLIEARLIKLVVAALPTDKARQFLAAVTKGDVLGAAFKALGTFRSLAAGLHFANGSFRTGLEIVATQTEDGNCSLDKQGTRVLYDQDEHTVRQAVGCLGLPTDSIFSLTTRDLQIAHVSPTAFDALMRIANGACTALPFLKPDGVTTPAVPGAAPAAAGAPAVAAPASAPIDSSAREKVCGVIWFTPKERQVSPVPVVH